MDLEAFNRWRRTPALPGPVHILGAAVLAVIVLALAAVCVILPSHYANTLVNDTGFYLVCEEDAGVPGWFRIDPGKTTQIDAHNCDVYTTSDAYAGCLLNGKFRTRLLAFAYDSSVARTDCTPR